jgi:hypothetical protein
VTASGRGGPPPWREQKAVQAADSQATTTTTRADINAPMPASASVQRLRNRFGAGAPSPRRRLRPVRSRLVSEVDGGVGTSITPFAIGVWRRRAGVSRRGFRGAGGGLGFRSAGFRGAGGGRLGFRAAGGGRGRPPDGLPGRPSRRPEPDRRTARPGCREEPAAQRPEAVRWPGRAEPSPVRHR